jgi:hypothetical protein
MKIRVFLRSQNPAIDPPSFHLKTSEVDPLFFEEFLQAEHGAMIGRGRARKIDRRSMQLIARGAHDPEHVSTYGNWSGGDPARWAIVGQTTRASLFPGCPTFQMIPCGRAGLNAE